jgi:prepilin-type N-terminal cleavage/methylation domain-containing protein
MWVSAFTAIELLACIAVIAIRAAQLAVRPTLGLGTGASLLRWPVAMSSWLNFRIFGP